MATKPEKSETWKAARKAWIPFDFNELTDYEDIAHGAAFSALYKVYEWRGSNPDDAQDRLKVQQNAETAFNDYLTTNKEKELIGDKENAAGKVQHLAGLLWDEREGFDVDDKFGTT